MLVFIVLKIEKLSQSKGWNFNLTYQNFNEAQPTIQVHKI